MLTDKEVLDYIESSGLFAEKAQRELNKQAEDTRAYLANVPGTVDALIKAAYIKEKDREDTIKVLSDPEEALRCIQIMVTKTASSRVDTYGGSTTEDKIYKPVRNDIWSQFADIKTAEKLRK